MRIYLPMAPSQLASLRDGEQFTSDGYAVSVQFLESLNGDVEAAEFAALQAASEASLALSEHRLVAAADVDAEIGSDGQAIPREPVQMSVIAAIHLGLDGHEHLSWYGIQEIDAVLALTAGSTSNHD